MWRSTLTSWGIKEEDSSETVVDAVGLCRAGTNYFRPHKHKHFTLFLLFNSTWLHLLPQNEINKFETNNFMDRVAELYTHTNFTFCSMTHKSVNIDVINIVTWDFYILSSCHHPQKLYKYSSTVKGGLKKKGTYYFIIKTLLATVLFSP